MPKDKTRERFLSGGTNANTYSKGEPTKGVRDIFTRGNLKFKSSEMARNGSKNVNSEVDF